MEEWNGVEEDEGVKAGKKASDEMGSRLTRQWMWMCEEEIRSGCGCLGNLVRFVTTHLHLQLFLVQGAIDGMVQALIT